jgi:hypothetical protein
MLGDVPMTRVEDLVAVCRSVRGGLVCSACRRSTTPGSSMRSIVWNAWDGAWARRSARFSPSRRAFH